MRISMIEVGWVAGFLEGEGSFGVQGKTPCVTGNQVQVYPLMRLRTNLGGRVYPMKGASNKLGKHVVSRWEITGRRAVGIMMTLYPLMSPGRQAQIRRALTIWRSVKPRVNVSDDDALAALRRVRRGESITAVAKALRVSDVVVGQWLRGRQRPHLLAQLEGRVLLRKAPRLIFRVELSDVEALVVMRQVRRGATITEAARMAGISASTLSRWLDGSSKPHLRAMLEKESV